MVKIQRLVREGNVGRKGKGKDKKEKFSARKLFTHSVSGCGG